MKVSRLWPYSVSFGISTVIFVHSFSGNRNLCEFPEASATEASSCKTKTSAYISLPLYFPQQVSSFPAIQTYDSVALVGQPSSNKLERIDVFRSSIVLVFSFSAPVIIFPGHPDYMSGFASAFLTVVSPTCLIVSFGPSGPCRPAGVDRT